MKKELKKVSCALALTLSFTMLGGCGKVAGVDVDGMIDRYSKCCDLVDYEGLEYTETKTEVNDEMVQSQIDELISQYSTTEQVKEGTAVMGDTVNIDFVGKHNGEEFEGGSSNGEGKDLELGSGTFIEGMEEQIANHKVGETFDITVKFPKEYPANQDLAGESVVFTITINYIVKVNAPEYNDEFIASYTDAKSVDEYETKLKEEMVDYYSKSDESYNKSAVMEALMDEVTIKEYPEKDMQEMIDDIINRVQKEADNVGYDFATYVTTTYGMASEQVFRDYISEQAKSYMKEKIVICSVAKKENLTVTKEDVEAIKKKVMEETGYTEKQLNEQYNNKDFVYFALSEKVYDILLEKGKGVPATNTDAQ